MMYEVWYCDHHTNRNLPLDMVEGILSALQVANVLLSVFRAFHQKQLRFSVSIVDHDGEILADSAINVRDRVWRCRTLKLTPHCRALLNKAQEKTQHKCAWCSKTVRDEDAFETYEHTIVWCSEQCYATDHAEG